MFMARRIGALVALAVTVAALEAGPAGAEPSPVSTVDSVSAVPGPGGVAVTGQATLVDVPVVVGKDKSGGASPVPIGDDLTSATISRPHAFGDTLTFSVGIANPPPSLDGIPELITYAWAFLIWSPGDGLKTFDLQAYRSSQWHTPDSTEPVFMLYRGFGPADGDEIGPVSGSMAGGVVEWHVPISAIGAQPGSVIVRSLLQANITFAGAECCTLDSIDPLTTKPYTVPGPSVRLGIAPAGTAPEDVPLTVDAALAADGTFTGALPAPTTPGAYTVVTQACYGTTSCGQGATSITV